MKLKYVIVLLVIVIAVGAGIGLKLFFKPHADITKMKTDFKVEAASLIKEFETDENSATGKYSEKALEISGNLAAKNKLMNGTDVLILEDEMQGISCQLDSSWAAKNQALITDLQQGSKITVKGICKGYLLEIKVSPAIVVQ